MDWGLFSVIAINDDLAKNHAHMTGTASRFYDLAFSLAATSSGKY
jgi:hypothetical protein